MKWLLALLLAAQAQSQEPAPVAPKRPVEIEVLADRVRALPAEFSADLHLKLAASPLISEVKWKRELIEKRFWPGLARHCRIARAGT